MGGDGPHPHRSTTHRAIDGLLMALHVLLLMTQSGEEFIISVLDRSLILCAVIFEVADN